MNEERVILGSGLLYVVEWTGDTIPDNSVIEVEANQLGEIKGGASLAYTPSYYEPKADNGRSLGKYITDEVATLKSGIMTINLKKINQLISTGQLTETATKRTLKIGGGYNYIDTKYIIRFLHKDATHGDVRVTIIGNNNTGLEFAFVKDKETIINTEFTAVPQDASGTLIIFEEEIPGVTIESIAITTPATKLVYAIGETLDITGMVVTGTYTNAVTQVEEVSESNISGFDSSVAAVSQELTVTINGKIDTYTIEIQV